MHTPATQLPAAPGFFLDPAGSTIAAQVFASRRAQIGYVAANVLAVGNYVFTVPTAGVQFKEATNGRMGTAVLVAGAKTVNNSSVTANSRIFVQRQTDGGTVGASYSITRVAGTSFSLQSKDGGGANQGADTSTLAWVIFEPSP